MRHHQVNPSKRKLNKWRKSRGYWYFMACTGLQVYSVHELKGGIYRWGCIVFVTLSTEYRFSLLICDTFSKNKQTPNNSEDTLIVWLSEFTCFRWNSPPPVFPHRSRKKQEGGARGGGHRWSCGLSVWCLGRMSETERGRAGCVGVKGRGVEERVMCSFPFCSACWLQALDFQRTHLPPLKSVWKLRPPGWMWERR